MTELQQKLLNLVCEIDKICRANNIPYYLVGGSLIGALRHRGFIPWDDDLDVIMTRDNWYRFQKACEGNLPEGLEIHSIDTDENAGNSVAHFEDMRTTAIYRFDVPTFERSGILIDILILDPLPDDEECKQRYRDKLTEYSDVLNLAYWYSIRVGRSLHFKKNYKKMKSIGRKQVLDNLSKDIFHFEESESAWYAQRLAGSPHFWPKEIFGTPRYVPFENTMLPIPARAGDCLCIGYDDDWMYVPQGGVTKSTHDFCVMSLTVPADYIMTEFKHRVDGAQLEQAYARKKMVQDAQAAERYQLSHDNSIFLAEKIRLSYEKKVLDTDIEYLVKNNQFETLDTFFKEYTQAQCTSKFLGSSALSGWTNWDRKCHPILIDIGDKYLAAAMHLYLYQKHLAWVGKLLKARHFVDRPFTQALYDIEAEYHAVKMARSHLECEEYEACYQILEQYQPLCPNNPFFCSIRLSLQVAQGTPVSSLLPEINEYLERFPSDPEILLQKANALQDLLQVEEAFQIYEQLIAQTTHGLVLQNIRDRIEQQLAVNPSRDLYRLWLSLRRRVGEDSLPSLESLCPSEPSTETVPEPDKEQKNMALARFALKPPRVLSPVQQRRMQLLVEVAQICKENKIRYYLFGKTLWQAAKSHKYTDVDGDLTIAMTPVNCKKFMEACSREARENRYLDSMWANPNFHRFCLRYADTESLDFTVSQCGASDKYGLFITIEVLRSPSKSKFRNQFDQMLEAGWESNLQMKWTSKKRWISYKTVSCLCALFGRKRIGKWMFTRFLNGPRNRKGGQYYLKPFWGKRTYYPTYYFKYTCGINLEGQRFTTMKPYKKYLLQKYGKGWKAKKIPKTEVDPIARIIDANISYAQYLGYLKRQNIDVAAIWNRRLKADRRYAVVSGLNAETARYWDIMCACGERYRLWDKYMPKRTYLLELFKSNAIKIMMQELKDYYDTAIRLSKQGYGLCFDQKIFELLESTVYKGLHRVTV